MFVIKFYMIILFFIAGGLIHLFLFFLHRTSGVLSSRLFRKLIPALWSGLFLIFVSIWVIQHRSEDRVRVACFPLITSDARLDIAITDGINTCLKKANPKEILVYPLDWSYDAIAKDSVSDVSYLLSYGKRIGLNLLMTEQVRSQFGTGCVVDLTCYDLEEGRCVSRITDSLHFDQTEVFFGNVLRRVMDFSSHDFDSLASPILPSVTVWREYSLARYYQLHDDLNSAEMIFKSVIAIDSTQPILLKGLASVLLEKGLRLQTDGEYVEDIYHKTADLLHRVLKIDSTDSEAYRLLGRLYIQKEWWNRAEKALQKSLQWEKDDPFLYLNLTHLHTSRYREMGYRNRESLLKHALNLNPALERAWIALGEDYYFRNRPDRTEKTYMKLLKIHPNSLDGLLALGKLYVFRNDVLNIIRVYEKVLEIEPDYADVYYNLGIAYYNDKKEEKAIRFFERAIELNNHVDSHLYLGIIHAKRGDREQAIEFLRKRIRLRRGNDDPFAEEARRNLYELLHNREQTS